jgi:hypothetical protein
MPSTKPFSELREKLMRNKTPEQRAEHLAREMSQLAILLMQAAIADYLKEYAAYSDEQLEKDLENFETIFSEADTEDINISKLSEYINSLEVEASLHIKSVGINGSSKLVVRFPEKEIVLVYLN